MCTWEDERVRDLLAEQESLRFEVRRQDEQLQRSDTLLQRAEDSARDWRRKLAALAESYRRRVWQVTNWSAKLGQERAALERERARLAEEVALLRSENTDLVERLSRVRGDALAGFLNSALDAPVDRDRMRRLTAGTDREQILTILGQKAQTAVRTG